MDDEKRKRLEDAGWKVGDAEEFLGAEHVHECEHSWRVFELSIDGMFCTKGCRGRLSREEMERRLNEYETLKKENEALKERMNDG